MDVGETLPRVVADAGLLERAIANVIANALVHGDGAPVRIVAGAVDGGVDLRVVDRGPGVPAGERERIFVPFQRLGDSPQGGSVGLGLAVARGFVEAMGGSVELEDTPGGGLTVVLRLKASGVTRILVVDDEPQILRALAANLKARGYAVDLAGTGEAALTLAQRHRPDAVILDLGLPGIDGLEVIEGLRGWTDVPIVVLSVREREAEKVAALDAGADDYVTKPFGMGELLARVRAALRRSTPGETGGDRRDGRTSASISPRSGSPTRPATTCASRRPNGASSRSSRAIPGCSSRSGSCSARSGGRSTRPRRTTCASTSRRSAASSSPTRRRPRYFLTEPRMGYRFNIGG